MKHTFKILCFLLLCCSLTVMTGCTKEGCTNPNASNYDSEANEDDGSCILEGCTNPNANNYDSEANEDDGSCVLWRDAFLGTYDAVQTTTCIFEEYGDSTVTLFSYELVVTASSLSLEEVIISPFFDMTDVIATVTNSNLIFSTNNDSIGTGTLSNDTLTLNYTSSIAGVPCDLEIICTKQ